MARITHGKVSFRPGDAGMAALGGVSGDRGAVELITVATATNSQWGSGDLTTALPNYTALKIVLAGIRTATVSSIGLRTSSDGTNYAAGAGAYSQAGYGISATDTVTQEGNFSDSEIILTSDNTASAFLATAAGDVMSGEFMLENFSATATGKFPLIHGYIMWQGAADIFARRIYARRSEAIPQAGVLVVNRAGGGFIDGKMFVYGIRAAD